jgi:hypothetical protein
VNSEQTETSQPETDKIDLKPNKTEIIEETSTETVTESVQKSETIDEIDKEKLKENVECSSGCPIVDQVLDESINIEPKIEPQQPPPPPKNCIKQFIDLRNEITKRHNELIKQSKVIKTPKNYNEFALYKKKYLIKISDKVNYKSISLNKPPSNILLPELKEIFVRQETDRYKLRLNHRIEQERLQINYEQQILRVFSHSKFGFCSLINDNEVYDLDYRDSNLIHQQQQVNSTTEENQIDEKKQEEEEGTMIAQLVNPSEKDEIIKKLTLLNSKFENIKFEMYKRQLNETHSLNAVQKMDYTMYKRLVVAEKKKPVIVGNIIESNTFSYNDISLQYEVPIVEVKNTFETFKLDKMINSSDFD